MIDVTPRYKKTYGGFVKQGLIPQNNPFTNGFCHQNYWKPSIFGCPHFRKRPFLTCQIDENSCKREASFLSRNLASVVSLKFSATRQSQPGPKISDIFRPQLVSSALMSLLTFARWTQCDKEFQFFQSFSGESQAYLMSNDLMCHTLVVGKIINIFAHKAKPDWFQCSKIDQLDFVDMLKVMLFFSPIGSHVFF